MVQSRASTARIALRIALAGSLVMGGPIGCANNGSNIFASAADANDACGREHAAFADSKSFYLQQVAQGALFGALSGAALGALTSAATGGSAGRGALIGAGAGTVVGGAAGYFNAQRQQNNDQAALANSVYGDITKASQEMDRATTTFGNLRNCRFAEARRIKAETRQGTLPRDQATHLLADHKRRFDDELALARQYGSKMAEQDEQFRFASDSLVSQDPEAQRIMATRQARIGAPKAAALPSGDTVAIAPINVRSGPSAGADRVGSIAKGEAVQFGSEPAADGWQQVVLADGTTGYVSTRFLGAAGSVVQASARPPLTSNNRGAQVAVAATETIPEKRAAYSKAVDDATQQSSLSFNLDQASPSA